VSRERIDSAIVVTENGLEIVPAAEVPRRTKLYSRKSAERLLAALQKDPIAVVIREFGPGATAS